MSSASNYLEEALLNHILNNVAYTSPTTVYVGLVDDTATEADLESGDLTNEITGYTGDRKAVSFTSPTQVSGKATVENDVEITFEDMPATTIAFAIVTDSATAGNILYHSAPTQIKTANAGDTYKIEVGDLTVDND